ncbi:MAG: hypothetical protein ABIH26_01985, partial [Candidatus Eisenbacteria bacterium]
EIKEHTSGIEHQVLAHFSENRPLRDKEKEEIREHISGLARILNAIRHRGMDLASHRYALRRLRRLRERGLLLELEVALRKPLAGDGRFAIQRSDPVFAEALNFFERRRPGRKRTNHADAAAVATAIRLNERLRGEREVALFSETPGMEALAREAETRLGSGTRIPLIRLGHIAHAIMWFGRRGLAEKSGRQADVEYLQGWRDLRGQLIQSKEELRRLLDRGLELDVATVERLDDAQECLRVFASQVARLEAKGVLDAQIETENAELMAILEGKIALPKEMRLQINRATDLTARLIEGLRTLLDDDARDVREIGRILLGGMKDLSSCLSGLVETVRVLDSRTEEDVKMLSEEWGEAFIVDVSPGTASIIEEVLSARFNYGRWDACMRKVEAYRSRRQVPQWEKDLVGFYRNLACREWRRATQDLNECVRSALRSGHSESVAVYEAEAILACAIGRWDVVINRLKRVPRPYRYPWFYGVEATALFELARRTFQTRKRSGDPRSRPPGREYRPRTASSQMKRALTSLGAGRKRAIALKDRVTAGWLWHKAIYYDAHLPVGRRRRDVEGKIRGIRVFLQNLEKRISEVRECDNLQEDRARVIDTLGFLFLRIGEVSRGAPRRRALQEAKRLFMDAYEIHTCDECVVHLAQATQLLERKPHQ